MKNYIAQGAGFRGDNDFLMFIQEIIKEVSQLATLGGDTYILKGCVNVAGTVSDGWMVLDGEIIPFTGGAIGTKVTIIEAFENVTYLEDINPVDGQGDSKQAYFTRTAKFGDDGVATYNWVDLKPVKPILQVQTGVIPIGGIIMYDGAISAIPPNFELYQIINGKVPVGYDANNQKYDTIGNQGGEEEHPLTESEMPQHNHDGSTDVDSGHTHPFQLREDNFGSGNGPSLTNNTAGNDEGFRTFNTQNSGPHSHSITTNNKGGGQAHNNMQPYVVVAYIRRVS